MRRLKTPSWIFGKVFQSWSSATAGSLCMPEFLLVDLVAVELPVDL